MSEQFVQTLWFMLNLCSPSGSSEFGFLLGKGRLHDQPPEESAGAESPESFPCSHGLSPRDSAWRGLLEACAPGLESPGLFPLLILLCVLSL